MEKVKVAVVSFKNDNERKFDFLTDLEDLNIGDLVVVHTARGPEIAEIKQLIDKSSDAHKWVIQKIDMAAHNEKIRKYWKKNELIIRMENRRKELSDTIDIYTEYAKIDKEMAKLVDEFNKLS